MEQLEKEMIEVSNIADVDIKFEISKGFDPKGMLIECDISLFRGDTDESDVFIGEGETPLAAFKSARSKIKVSIIPELAGISTSALRGELANRGEPNI